MKKILTLLTVFSLSYVTYAAFPVFEKSAQELVTSEKINVVIEPKTEAALYMDDTMLWLCILGFIIGICGLHRFYKGQTWLGILMLLTLGGLGVWQLIDLIRIVSGNMSS